MIVDVMWDLMDDVPISASFIHSFHLEHVYDIALAPPTLFQNPIAQGIRRTGQPSYWHRSRMLSANADCCRPSVPSRQDADRGAFFGFRTLLFSPDWVFALSPCGKRRQMMNLFKKNNQKVGNTGLWKEQVPCCDTLEHVWDLVTWSKSGSFSASFPIFSVT